MLPCAAKGLESSGTGCLGGRICQNSASHSSRGSDCRAQLWLSDQYCGPCPTSGTQCKSKKGGIGGPGQSGTVWGKWFCARQSDRLQHLFSTAQASGAHHVIDQ